MMLFWPCGSFIFHFNVVSTLILYCLWTLIIRKLYPHKEVRRKHTHVPICVYVGSLFHLVFDTLGVCSCAPCEAWPNFIFLHMIDYQLSQHQL